MKEGTMIRKLAVAAVLAAVVAGAAEAQVARKYVGLAGGATYTDLTNYNVSTEWRWGGTAGVFGGVTTFDYSYVELAPSWIQLGGGDFGIDYVEIPLLLGGMMPVGNRDALFRLYAGVGINVNWSQIMADIIGLPMHRQADARNNNVIGIALLAFQRLGLIRLEAIPHMIKFDRVFEPDPEAGAVYGRMCVQFMAARKKIRLVFRALNR